MEKGLSTNAGRALSTASKWGSRLVITVGMWALIGWVFDIQWLRNLHPSFASMKVNTALALILAGVSLRLQLGLEQRRLARALAAVVLVLGAATLVEHAFAVDLHIDQLIFHDARSALPGRMSIATAAQLVALGAALLLLDTRVGTSRQRPSEWLALAAGVSSLLALLGYLYGVSELYHIGVYGSVALHTAAAELILSVAIVFARPDDGLIRIVANDGPAGTMTRRILPVVLFAPPAIGWLRLEGQRLGLYGTSFGLALFAASNVVGMTLLIWWTGAKLMRADTERRAEGREAEAALRESREAGTRAEEDLRRVEDQLRQAQKMEAIGRLAGGVAHDFNNLLAVILSYSSLMAQDLRADDPMRAEVDEITHAAERAAGLTRQLLAFSRQQVLSPRVVDINECVTGLTRMLQRVIGEDIELLFRPAQELRPVFVDPSQIEQVILNLVVNARDAMPRGGKLSIESANVELDESYAREHLGVKPGAYVMLSVSDTGCGMDRATQARIFEPFFTTKEQGKGTGLGLSTVFGIVKQSGGSIFVYSEPGVGSTFKIYLPPSSDEVRAQPDERAQKKSHGHETVLLVEDEEQVRRLARTILKRGGYRVLEAADAGDALTLSGLTEEPIDLLLTDVVMPHVSGRELAERLTAARPGLRVLYMSGYTDDAVVRHGVLHAEAAFVQKPFTPHSLLAKVRELLDART